MRAARAQADAVLAGYQRVASAAGADKARAKTADARAARLVQHRQKQTASNDVSCTDPPSLCVLCNAHRNNHIFRRFSAGHRRSGRASVRPILMPVWLLSRSSLL